MKANKLLSWIVMAGVAVMSAQSFAQEDRGPGPGGPGFGGGRGPGGGDGGYRPDPGPGGWGGGHRPDPGPGPGPGPRPGPPMPPTPPPPPVTQVVPVYRFNNGHHFLTLDYQEGVNARMNYEGIAFYVSTQPTAEMIPLYRCYNPAVGDHMLSNNSNCEGYQFEGLIGWLSPSADQFNPIAVYRCFSPMASDHLSTVNSNECLAAGYRVEMVQGYVSH